MPEDKKKTVLLVEDDLFLSQLLTTRLQRVSINVVKVFDGEEAVKTLKSTKPDLMLMDIILPKKSGFEVMEEIHSNPTLQDGPIVVISNLGQDTDIARARALGAVDYLIKAQTSIDDLVLKIQGFLKK
ncbi:MAG: response regulator [Candidatus Andersenbacteria bacterium]|nr:response regulator [Candidatus Andersenbacteria bacterium]